MAEFVEFRTEEMVPELEQLEKYRIFNDAEIRNIIKTRKKFQYKIQRVTKHLEDYVRYIQYEMDLLMLVKARRKKLGLVEKKHQVDMIVAKRVNLLFEQALFKFSDDINLWLSYLKFCKQIKIFSANVSNKLIAMLGVHSSKPSLWKLAANWEFEENKSVENAIQFIMRGLRHHPSSKLLFEEAFRLELIYSERKRKEMESEGSKFHPGKQEVSCISSVDPDSTCSNPMEISENTISVGQPSQSKLFQLKNAIHNTTALTCTAENDSIDPIIDCQNAKFIYENAIKRIPDASFLISLLNIAKNFDSTEKLQAEMMRDLLLGFPDDELTWDTLAHLELEGVHFASDYFTNTEENEKEPAESTVPPHAAKTENEKLHYTRIRRCFTVYQNGLKHLNTERMWELYLDAVIKMNQDLRILKKVKRKLLFSAFQSAHDANRLQEKHYIHWAGIYSASAQNLSIVLHKATEKFPSSLELWQKLLHHYILQDQEKNVMDIFKCAIDSLGNNESAVSIWKLVIQYWEKKSVDKVQELFEDGMKQGPSVASALKQLYLEWLVSVKGIQAARKAYDTVCSQPPFSFDVHKKMIELECLQSKVKMIRVTRCFELACDQFGKNDIDVWMEYVKFEVKKGDPKKVKEIHQRALKTLNKDLVQQFISIFCEYWTVHKLED